MMLARGASILPHLFTLGNAFFGFLSIVFASKSIFIASAYCILIGALMDALDGRVARFFNVASPLGVELDSLCDAITFCLAPALLIYFQYLQKLGPFGFIVCVAYVLAGIFRLARFNLISDQQTLYFLGLPTTASALFLVSLILNLPYRIGAIITILLACLILLLAVLMVSSISFPAFKSKKFRLEKYSKMILITLFAIITVLKFKRILLICMVAYLVGAIFLLKKKNKPVF